MPKATARLWVSYNQYSVQGEAFDVSGWDYTGFNGLVAAITGAGRLAKPGELGEWAVVMTGTEMGYVRVTADVRDTAPEQLDLDGWDDVAEVSLALTGERAGVVTDSDADELDKLPEFTAVGPGPYRVRVHARGRDEGNRALRVSGEPVEEHLIVMWRAPYSPEVVHKATDAYGAELRLDY